MQEGSVTRLSRECKGEKRAGLVHGFRKGGVAENAKKIARDWGKRGNVEKQCEEAKKKKKEGKQSRQGGTQVESKRNLTADGRFDRT